MPNSLMSSKRRPNLPPEHNLRKEFARENNLPIRNMSNATPAKVLPNGNVVLTNGNVLNGSTVAAHANMSNATSVPQQTLPGGNKLMSNGNTVSPMGSSSAGMPSAIVNGNVVMSNGNTVSPSILAQIPPQSPSMANQVGPIVNTSAVSMNAGVQAANAINSVHANAINSGMHAANVMSGNMAQSNYQVMSAMNNLHGACAIAPPASVMNYCTPAPFHSAGGERYFYVGEAYGRPVASSLTTY